MSQTTETQNIWEFISPHITTASQRTVDPPSIKLRVRREIPVRDLYEEEMQRRRAERRGGKPPMREAIVNNPIEITRGATVQLAPNGKPLVRSIIAATISASGISHGLLVGPARSQSIMVWRFAAMYLSKKLTGASYPEIGRQFRRDHTTVLHACQVAGSREDVMRCADAIRAVFK